MASIKYEEIFSDFLGRITDYQLASLNMSDAYSLMTEKLNAAISEPYIYSLFAEFELDDEIQTITFTMEYPINDKSDINFVKNVLARGMVVEWLQSQVKSKLNINQYFGDSDKKWYSQASHLAEVRGLLSDARIELDKMITDRGFIYNDYLEVT